MTDFSSYRFRCSSLGNIMTNQRGKKDTKSVDDLSETAIAELVKIFVREVYGRDKEITSKYMEKGLQAEEDAITLLSRVHGKFFKKNETRFENDFITGEPDVISPSLHDTKSCWDIHTFFAHKIKGLPKAYEYQLQGYCELTGQDSGTVAFCLIDTPLGLIEDEKRKLFYKMNVPTMENPQYLEACEKLEREMTFGDIPLRERLHEVEVQRNPEVMEQVYERITICREWLNRFAETYERKPELVA